MLADLEVIETNSNLAQGSQLQALSCAPAQHHVTVLACLCRSRDAINKLMMKKFNDVILHYGKEVEKMEAIFNAFKDKPPIHKNHPSGADQLVPFPPSCAPFLVYL